MAKIIDWLHVLVKKDPISIEISNAIDSELLEVKAMLKDISKQDWLDTMTWGADYFASILKIKFSSTATLAEKRSIIEARWKNGGKSDLYLLQTIADSWKNGETKIRFVGGRIQVSFVGNYGVPSDLESLKRELENANPVHLLLEYIFFYMPWIEFEAYEKKWNEWDALNLTFDEFEVYKE